MSQIDHFRVEREPIHNRAGKDFSRGSATEHLQATLGVGHFPRDKAHHAGSKHE